MFFFFFFFFFKLNLFLIKVISEKFKSCEEHKNEDEKIKLFCKDDNEACCTLCHSVGKHKNHNCVLISELIKEKEKILIEKILNLNLNVKDENEIISKIEKKILLIKKNNENIEKEIDKSFNEILIELEKRKKYLKERNELFKNFKINILENQKNIFKTDLEKKQKIEENFKNSILFYSNSNFNNIENLNFNIESEKKLELILKNFKIEKELFIPLIDEKIKCDFANKEIIEKIKDFGNIEEGIEFNKIKPNVKINFDKITSNSININFEIKENEEIKKYLSGYFLVINNENNNFNKIIKSDFNQKNQVIDNLNQETEYFFKINYFFKNDENNKSLFSDEFKSKTKPKEKEVVIQEKETLAFGVNVGIIKKYSSQDERIAENIRNGENNGWVANTSQEEFIEIELKNKFLLTRFVLKNYYSKKFKICYSIGGVDYKVLKDWTNCEPSSNYDFNVELNLNIIADHIKFFCGDGNKTSWFIVNIYGKSFLS
jgi:hypothetical protein